MMTKRFLPVLQQRIMVQGSRYLLLMQLPTNQQDLQLLSLDIN